MRHLFISILLILHTLYSISQDGSTPYLRGGYNLSMFRSDFIETSPRHGFTIGLGLYGNISDRFKLLTEIGFKTDGAKTIAQREIEPEFSFQDPEYEDIEYDQFSARFTWNGLLGYELIDDKLLSYAGANITFFGFPAFANNDLAYYENGALITTTEQVQSTISGVSIDPNIVVGTDYGNEDYRISLRYYHGILSKKFMDQNEEIRKIGLSSFQICFTYIFSDVRLVYSDK